MNTIHNGRQRALFELALETLPGDYRALLERECPDDPRLARSVAELVEAHLAAESETDRTGELIGPYRILRQIGKGGMGAVYLVAGSSGQPAALKTIRPDIASPEMIARFRNEREVLRRLNHPDIVRVHEVGDAAGGLPYYVMDYVEGFPLDRYCTGRKLPLRKRLVLFRRLCLAVDHLHQNNIIHRDLKPSNVLVTATGDLKLIDFGIAKQQQPLAQAGSQISQTMLTPGYASPEQHSGLAATQASDIYALGVILYELLTGDRPAPDPEPPSAHALPEVAGVSKEIDTAVLNCLRRDPAARCLSAQQLAASARESGVMARFAGNWL